MPTTLLHGVPLSQPFRAVAWACLQKRLPFEIKMVVPGSSRAPHGSRSEDYLRLNPAGTVPLLQDDLVTLAESPAILTYLAERHGWDDLYPSDVAGRAAVNAALHWHHGNTRLLASAYFAPVVRPDLKISEETATLHRKTGARALALLDSMWLGTSSFVAGRSEPSVADLLIYEEVAQLSPRFTNLLDLSPYPRVEAWLSRMSALPAHDAAHASLAELGALGVEHGVPLPERLSAASKAGFRALVEAQQPDAGVASKL